MLMLDRISKALNMPVEQADVTVTALQAAFETNGKELSYSETAWIVLEALSGNLNDPNVQYAAEWLKSLRPGRHLP